MKKFLSRWKEDYEFKTLLSALFSLAVTTAFALYNGYLGIAHSSVWHGSICVYYLLLSALRGFILFAERSIFSKQRGEKARKKGTLSACILLLFINFSLIAPISLMVTEQKPVSLSLVAAIAMAAYTTYKIIMASVHLKKRMQSGDSLVKLLRTIGFIDALVSLLSLQNTLIMVNHASGGKELLPLTAFTSFAVILVIVILSLVHLKGAIVALKQE